MQHSSSTDSSSIQSSTGHKTIPNKRKLYSRLTQFQLSELNKRFKMNPYLTGEEKESMSRNLDISMNRLAIWFKDKRRRGGRKDDNSD